MWHSWTKFTAHWVTHGDNHSTHILHPTLGMLWFSARRTGTNPTSPAITKLLLLIPIPACLNNLIHPALEPVQKITLQLPQDISPWMLSLSSHDHN